MPVGLYYDAILMAYAYVMRNMPLSSKIYDIYYMAYIICRFWESSPSGIHGKNPKQENMRE